ncbi:MAG: 3-phosphoshikimate 1-carboxyvinyltransferase [Brevundimonas sp.]|jgi:3-phosphoshikimate 1-carboxyvinyltransferase|uniref:3-phosphoshikimate 1-carboxyvinyltransferase n=1 Tax=Brevundimonas sp. TaxID=1871086 RepID=UPI00391D043F
MLPPDLKSPASLSLTAHRAPAPLKGRVRAPSDKSISHRALILAGLADGESLIHDLLEGDDVLATARAVAALGAEVERIAEGQWWVRGQGRFSTPRGVIDCGNAGTGVRLLMGAIAGQGIAARLDGDASLRSRPMKRVLDPLERMGAMVRWHGQADRLPLTLTGAALSPISHTQTIASAQVKSAILLAGLGATGTTEVIEPVPTRDHLERMLPAFGVPVEIATSAAGTRIGIHGPCTLSPAEIHVPSDPSSAAFLLAAALIVPGSEVTLEGVMLNRLRTGLLTTWAEMGADIEITNRRVSGGEEVGDITARHGPLAGVIVPPQRAPSMIDEYPVLAVTAAFATGRTVMRGIGEMRVKESDRIALMARGLAACGVDVTEEPEGLIVTGGPVRGGATIDTAHDHRIAMSHLVLGLGAEAPVTVRDAEMITTSFPGFGQLMARTGAPIFRPGDAGQHR